MVRKAKFKVGQVVRLRENNSYYQVKQVERRLNGCVTYDIGTLVSWHENELRRLTAREKGNS